LLNAYRFDENDPSKVIISAKGIPKCKLYKAIRLKTFVDAYFAHPQTEKIVYQSIRFEKGELVTRIVNRVSLNSFDDKRYITFGTHETLPFGHIKTRTKKKESYPQTLSLTVIINNTNITHMISSVS
jgi:hypothetical protein